MKSCYHYSMMIRKDDPMNKTAYKVLTTLLVLALLGSMTACRKDNAVDEEAEISYEPETVAQPLDLETMFARPVNGVQDFHYWTDKEFSYESNPHRDKDPQVFYYFLDIDAMTEYANMLQDNGFSLVKMYSNSKTKTMEWALTSDQCPDAETIHSVLTKVKCHVTIRSSDTRKFRVDVSPDLQVCDMGLRRDGSVVDVLPKGASAGAGLIQLEDGSYQTSDGRLTAAVGTAMVLRDGEVCNTTAEFSMEKGHESIKTGNYYRDQFVYLQHLENSLMAGDIFRQQDLAGESEFEELDNDGVKGRNFGSKPGVVISHGAKALLPSFLQDNFEDVTLRVMYYQKGGDAVYYVYGRFSDNTQPKEVEALIAVNMAVDGVMEDTTYLTVYSDVTVTYTHREFGSKYDVFTWEVIDGKGKVNITSTGDSCVIEGVSPGFALVRVTYEYGVEEPDVLTGITTTVTKSLTEDYHIIVE